MTAILEKPASIILSRRGFMMSGGAFGVAVAFGAPAQESLAADAAAASFKPNVWVTIGTDDIVTIYFALAEMGQGIMTALPLMLAEEMDADWAKVRVVQSPSDGKTYGTAGVLGTFGSTSIKANFEKLRLIGAQTRKVLLFNAALKWKLPVEELSTEPGMVIHKKSGQTISYGALSADARIPDPMPEAAKTDLKPASAFRYIGKDVARVDIPLKVNGSAVFGIDTQQANMLYGAILHPLVQGEKPEAVDDAAAKAIDGIVRIVILSFGVGVIGETIEATLKAKKALRVKWSETSKARGYTSAAVMIDYSADARDMNRAAVTFFNEGDAPAAIAGAAKTLSAQYLNDHVAHFCMEPMNATALLNGDGSIDIWASNQSPTNIINAIAGLTGSPPAEKINVHSTFIGGGFGRRYEFDFALDAFLLAREMPGRPVKLIYSREDDVQKDVYRPLVAQQIDVGLDAKGNFLGWRHRIVGESYFARTNPGLLEKLKGKDGLVATGGEFHYAMPAHLIEYIREERGIAIGALRGIAAGYTVFAVESMMDEVAALNHADPIAFRTQLLKDKPRAVKVLETVAQMANWGEKRPGRGLGVAYSSDLGFMAVIAEISLDAKSGAIRVHNLWCALDAGIVIQPRNITAQVEGSLLFGMGPALFEQLNIKNGGNEESNFGEYRVMRMSDTPEVHIQLVPTDNPPSGAGESGVPPIAPAIANAFANLTGGNRIRQLPMLPERLKAAMAKEASL